jgi:hypothetical protein
VNETLARISALQIMRNWFYATRGPMSNRPRARHLAARAGKPGTVAQDKRRALKAKRK